ncbi:MAG: 16S rRNA (cytosine(1402)-N(4))-methyltransferase RsmH [Acidobacteria bacterium]|nr:16S rRNA (cytosine(1402)-N(4))-methyltransferase RsmH [Acidobacteriota bacterium]
METEKMHVPVMLSQVIQFLQANEGGLFVDCTLGMGGHARAILESEAGSVVLGIDRDAEALEIAREGLARYGARFAAVHANFKDVAAWAPRCQGPIKGILVDLGMSTYQLRSQRGFSFKDDALLDMRMDRSRGTPASDFLARATEDQLVKVFREFGEEPFARPIAKAIVRERANAPVAMGRQLAALVEAAVPARMRRGNVHPATRVFQALRIHVNQELEGLDGFVREAAGLLESGGRIVVLAYHSLEDRLVKQALRSLAMGCTCPPKLPVCGCGRKPVLRLLTPRAVKASEDEIRANPASRSARLRAAVKV